MVDPNFTTASPEQWRELRGRQLAKQMAGKIRKCGQRWLVPSSAGGAGYLVDPVEAKCTCPDHELHGAKCKHLHAVEYLLIWAQTEAPSGTVTEAPVMRRKTYAQPSWPAYHAAQVHEKEHVEQLLRALCEGIVTPPQTMGTGARDHEQRQHDAGRHKHRSCRIRI